jgi:hypothetical protein
MKREPIPSYSLFLKKDQGEEFAVNYFNGVLKQCRLKQTAADYDLELTDSKAVFTLKAKK